MRVYEFIFVRWKTNGFLRSNKTGQLLEWTLIVSQSNPTVTVVPEFTGPAVFVVHNTLAFMLVKSSGMALNRKEPAR